ncbi:neuropeptide Y receptor type 5 [Gracilinanus agilis]|uniref:neuropeptide Y receptor type 5 n=1 Tax=Gracilinanus agilis TaxID=191870 RepID=UPI001CFD950A|nr:neuropeptide Y receptor type 5 [Gracilinanus agilis]
MDLEPEDYDNRNLTNENGTEMAMAYYDPEWVETGGNKTQLDDVQVFVIGLYSTISVLGFMGNMLILMALMKKCKQKTIVNFFIGNLAFSDILVVLFCSPFTLSALLLDQWVLGELMCRLMPFLQCTSVLVSTLILISIAIVRYQRIKYPLSKSLTVRQGCYLVGLSWAVGFVICSPLPIFYRLVEPNGNNGTNTTAPKYVCVEAWPKESYRIAFSLCLLVVQYILPLICLIVSHTSVCRSITCKMSTRDMKKRLEEKEKREKKERKEKEKREKIQLPKFQRWSYTLSRKHRKMYNKKSCVVPVLRHPPPQEVPAKEIEEEETPAEPERCKLTNASQIIPGVPICFVLKPEEKQLEEPEMLTISRSISRIRKRSRRVVYRLTILIIVFAVSWMPLHLFHVVTDFNAGLLSNRHFRLVYCICHLLGMLSCCLNPVLYGFLNNGIKADLMALLRCG